MRTGAIRTAEISQRAIAANVRRVAEVSGSQVIAVLKANGYGHGAAIVAEAALAGGAAALGVADLEEALALRDSGFGVERCRILCWLHGVNADFGAAVAHDIEIGVSHLEQLSAVAAAATQQGKCASVQLKLDTGLSRNGADGREWEALFQAARDYEVAGAVRVTGLFSHLANAGAQEDLEQAIAFESAIALAHKIGLQPEMLHLAASAAALGGVERLQYNTVRVGMAIYGLSPYPDKTAAELELQPAMKLTAEIIALRSARAGTGVSYGYNYRCPADTVLALLPVGYADGMPRALNNVGATVSVNGEKREIVGRIGMDQCIIDLGQELGSRVKLGDRIVLFGDPQQGETPVEEWAEQLETINYEVVAGIGPRVKRVAV
ncbi:alanine racemase [Canibacter oris]|uniref:Alanine racemase n=1 Tax=Canibacter oris TaxID=1365628 RepID=A0A840DCM6_9MICO|nr:alanine racemase [Canibacter oris]